MAVAIMIGVVGCKSGRDVTAVPADATTGTTTLIGGQRPVAALPKAIVYKTNVEVDDRVPISVDEEGGTVLSYPAPTDITGASAPIRLADGYLLDRRGISRSSRFLQLSYEEYRSLGQVPSTEELLGRVIPEARVVEIWQLPMRLSDAVSDTASVNAIIRNDFQDCRLLYRSK